MDEGLGECRQDDKDNCSSFSDLEQDYNSNFLYPSWVHVGVVACGDRQPETTVAVKAIMVTARSPVYFHIFTEDNLKVLFQQEFDSWPDDLVNKMQFQLYSITYPPEKFDEWKKVFKTCATQRLFMPIILKNVDSLLYIDTDILLMRPVQDIWAHFAKFNSSQLAAVAPEHESPNAGWYNRFARHPYFGKLGINSGVMLMNLTRIRQFPWLQHIDEYFDTYRYNISWGDQDLLNILFHHYPEFVYIFDCSWNYRPDHCMYMSVCRPAELYGISVLHGNRGVLHNQNQPAFKSVYNAFNKYKFDGLLNLLKAMKVNLSKLKFEEGRCESVKDLFYKQFQHHV
ncbi:GXYLT1 [Bugula neritina]|uniref:UDP-D-xylose:beta-D-glucoside alpha-1,3-D-xylosyltransferase n=1 Tax=Bugula neritina TaxID=10212 RepID=A0A7J7K4A2_BUGNE|nr:GXYLT1 [Bugula neritina]